MRDFFDRAVFWLFLFIPLGLWIVGCWLFTRHRNHRTEAEDWSGIYVSCRCCPWSKPLSWEQYRTMMGR